jgi:hypothetical protein
VLALACSLGLSATSQQYFSLRTNQPPATSRNQPAVFFSQNKPAPAISHQPTEQAIFEIFSSRESGICGAEKGCESCELNYGRPQVCWVGVKIHMANFFFFARCHRDLCTPFSLKKWKEKWGAKVAQSESEVYFREKIKKCHPDVELFIPIRKLW